MILIWRDWETAVERFLIEIQYSVFFFVCFFSYRFLVTSYHSVSLLQISTSPLSTEWTVCLYSTCWSLWALWFLRCISGPIKFHNNTVSLQLTCWTCVHGDGVSTHTSQRSLRTADKAERIQTPCFFVVFFSSLMPDQRIYIKRNRLRGSYWY